MSGGSAEPYLPYNIRTLLMNRRTKPILHVEDCNVRSEDLARPFRSWHSSCGENNSAYPCLYFPDRGAAPGGKARIGAIEHLRFGRAADHLQHGPECDHRG